MQNMQTTIYNLQDAITISSLSKKYNNGVKALDDINLEIKKGEFFALLGANGAGKTTIINILTDLVVKTAGKVVIGGVDIDKDFVGAKMKLGVVPQEFNFNIFQNVIDIVANQGGYYGLSKKEAYKRAKEILTRLGLGNKLNVKSMTLSGGMKRRLMIARGLIHNPEILILDEPTAGVDVEQRHGMWEYLKEINEKNGVTIILTTHYLEEVEQLCSRAAIINKGKIVKIDKVSNLLSQADSIDYIIDLDPSSKISLDELNTQKDFIFNSLDTLNTTVDVSVAHKQTLNQLINFFTTKNLIVKGIRPKENRLEKLFLDIINS
jgi:ABC-2 type transport system ATP-binding protein